MTRIDNFIDFNHKNVAFDLTGVDKHDLWERLDEDYVNHLRELEDANYFAIWNCDCQGFERECDIYFITGDLSYTLCKLMHTKDGWFYEVIGPRMVCYDVELM